MKVRELVAFAFEFFETITVDETIRAIRGVIREVNATYRGIERRVVAVDEILQDGFDSNGYNVYLDDMTLNKYDLDIEESVGVGDVIYINNVPFITIDDGYTIYSEEFLSNNIFSLEPLTSLNLPDTTKEVSELYINDSPVKYVKAVNYSSSEPQYTFESPTVIRFNYKGKIDKIDVVGRFVFSPIRSLDDEIDIPAAWENLFYTGLLYYVYRMPRFKDAENMVIQQQLYYQTLKEFSDAGFMMSLKSEDNQWDYAKAKER